MQLFLEDAKGLPLGSGDDRYTRMDNYYTHDYDFSTIADQLSGCAITASNSDPNIKSLSYTVALESATTIRVIFKPVSGYTGDLYARADQENTTVPLQSKRWTVDIPNVPAHLLGNGHSIMARTDDSGGNAWNIYASIDNLSVMTYALLLLQNGNDAAKSAGAALYSYWQAAVAFKEAH